MAHSAKGIAKIFDLNAMRYALCALRLTSHYLFHRWIKVHVGVGQKKSCYELVVKLRVN